LHSALRKQGVTLKDRFAKNAWNFVYEDKQLAIDFSGSADARGKVSDIQLKERKNDLPEP
jgi:hypothetical protein